MCYSSNLELERGFHVLAAESLWQGWQVRVLSKAKGILWRKKKKTKHFLNREVKDETEKVYEMWFWE